MKSKFIDSMVTDVSLPSRFAAAYQIFIDL